MTDPLQQAIVAQEKILALQADGLSPNDPKARQAVNRLMARLRKLSPEERVAFDAWKASRREPLTPPGEGISAGRRAAR